MAAAELWQVYDSHGNAVSGHGEAASVFDLDHSLYMANSHVWVYRDGPKEREILLQKRAEHLPRRPGYLHASASGHVNVDEQPLTAAIREANEELGIKPRSDDLKFLFMQQGGRRSESFNHVFACMTEPSWGIRINHDEVESVGWIKLSDFDKMTLEPEAYKLIDLGREYFDRLLASIRAA